MNEAANEKSIISSLVNEVLQGEHLIDRQLNSAFDFANETQAMYFSNARRYLSSDLGFYIMTDNQDLKELCLYNKIKGI